MSFTGSHTTKQVVTFSLVGFFIGLISYCTILTAANVLLFPLLLCFLYCKGGYIPVFAGIAGFALTFPLLVGTAATLPLALVLVLPALVTIIAASKGLPYFTQLKLSVATFAGSVALLLVGAGAMTGGNLVDIIVDGCQSLVNQLPLDTQIKVLSQLYDEVGTTTALTAEEVAALGNYWKDMFLELRESLVLQLFPTLLRSSLTTAFLCSYFTARTLRLRNSIGEEAFVPLSKWRISGQMTVGILLTTLAAYLLNVFGFQNGASVFLTMFTIMGCVFAVQGIAAWDRVMVAAKVGFVRKMITVGCMYVIASFFITGIGIVSAIFGREGLLMKMMKNPPKK